MTAVQSIPREAVTANDCGPAVSVITWILLVSVLGYLPEPKKKYDKANIHDIGS